MLLIHGLSGTPATWMLVQATLAQRHEVLAATLLGHRGGPEYLPGAAASPAAMADALEREMDGAGLVRAHLVGTSLGGWLALELAARGRALSTTALAPAGGWNQQGPEARRLRRLFRQNELVSKLLGPVPAHLIARRRFRALALRYVVVRPSVLPAAIAVEMLQAAADCTIYLPLMRNVMKAGFGELQAIDSPVQIVWGTKDRILPWPGYAERFRRLVPGAEWVVLAGLGHCPMLDDAQLTARTILSLTRRADADHGAHH